MIKYVCDICGKESYMRTSMIKRNMHMGNITNICPMDICLNCNNELDKLVTEVEYSFYKKMKGKE